MFGLILMAFEDAIKEGDGQRLFEIYKLFLLLGTGHKVTARVGRCDLGWAMENLWVVMVGHQFFCMSTVGPPNKNPCLLQKKNNKSKQNYTNYQMGY